MVKNDGTSEFCLVSVVCLFQSWLSLVSFPLARDCYGVWRSSVVWTSVDVSVLGYIRE